MQEIRKKTIVLDVDGTLTLPKMMSPSEKVKQSLLSEIKAGNEVVIASGRPLQTIIPIVENVGCLPITVLTSNGNLTLRLPDRKIMGYYPLNKKACIPIIEKLVENGVSAYVVLCDKHKIERGEIDANVKGGDYLKALRKQQGTGIEVPEIDLSKYQNCEKFFGVVDFAKVEEMVNDDILNIHIHPSSIETTDKLIELLKELESEDLEVKKSGEKIIELFNPLVNKGIVLENLKYQGLVVFMGDSENDIAGIEWAISHKGYGIAMGNALDSVKEKSNFITKSVEEDGIVHALEWINAHQ